MAQFQVPNKAYIKRDDSKYGNAIQALEDAIANISRQGNFDPMSAQAPTPTPPVQVSVTAAAGIHDVQIVDNSPAYNGLKYFAEYSQSADFQNSHVIDMGESQNHRANLGPGKYFWRATSKYPASQASPPVYHGNDVPAAVGTGDYTGPPMQAGQSFTGPYRNSTTPPVRE